MYFTKKDNCIVVVGCMWNTLTIHGGKCTWA